MNIASHHPGGTKFYGETGWIHVDRGRLEASADSILKEPLTADDPRLYKSRDHWGNFIDCVKSREETITPAETAHRSASVGHLCNAAIYTGRKIRWNPQTERIAGDPGATEMLSPNYRPPWMLG